MNKMVLIIAMVMLTAAAYMSFGTIGLSFQSGPDTLYQSDGTSLLPAESLFLAYHSSDSNMNGFVATPDGVMNPVGGDTLLSTNGLNTTSGGPFDGRFVGVTEYYEQEDFGGSDDGFVGGYAYVAVFDMLYADFNGSSVPAGTQYALVPGTAFGELTDKDTGGPLGTPDDFGAAVNSQGPFSTTETIIPEPGTLAFALIGLATILYRRVRK